MSPSVPSRGQGLAIFSHVPNFIAAFASAFAVYVIPRFAAIYRDMHGPGPLPMLTVFVLNFQPLWMLLAFVFVSVALHLAWKYPYDSPPASACVVLLLAASAETVMILIALFRPLTGSTMRLTASMP